MNIKSGHYVLFGLLIKASNSSEDLDLEELLQRFVSGKPELNHIGDSHGSTSSEFGGPNAGFPSFHDHASLAPWANPQGAGHFGWDASDDPHSMHFFSSTIAGINQEPADHYETPANLGFGTYHVTLPGQLGGHNGAMETMSMLPSMQQATHQPWENPQEAWHIGQDAYEDPNSLHIHSSMIPAPDQELDHYRTLTNLGADTHHATLPTQLGENHGFMETIRMPSSMQQASREPWANPQEASHIGRDVSDDPHSMHILSSIIPATNPEPDHPGNDVRQLEIYGILDNLLRVRHGGPHSSVGNEPLLDHEIERTIRTQADKPVRFDRYILQSLDCSEEGYVSVRRTLDLIKPDLEGNLRISELDLVKNIRLAYVSPKKSNKANKGQNRSSRARRNVFAIHERELLKYQGYWYAHWSRKARFDFVSEVRKLDFLPTSKIFKILPLYLFYVEMITEIVIEPAHVVDNSDQASIQNETERGDELVESYKVFKHLIRVLRNQEVLHEEISAKIGEKLKKHMQTKGGVRIQPIIWNFLKAWMQKRKKLMKAQADQGWFLFVQTVFNDIFFYGLENLTIRCIFEDFSSNMWIQELKRPTTAFELQ